MCWIFWYFGSKNNAPELTVEWLKKLEYRWYDSWWIAYPVPSVSDKFKWSEKFYHIVKKVWKISEFNWQWLDTSSIAIWHSRWATHWWVTETNAHPHFSEEHDVVVVHNWIIENYVELRDELTKEWHKFLSQTDTEVIPHLIEKYLDFGPEIAFSKAMNRLEWRFAVVAMIKNEKKLFVARRWSPLIIWVWKNEYFLASDIPAFLSSTRDINYLDDDEMVVISDKWLEYKNFITWKNVQKRIVKIDLKEDSAEKWDFAHFMLKEIMDQKLTIASSINQDESQIFRVAEAIKNAKWTFLVWCWTAWKVCHAWMYFFAQISWKHVNSVPASEFPIYHQFLNDKSLLIVVSQSWETADVLEAINVAKKKWVQIIALVNAKWSSIERAADFTLNINAWIEKAVASTKAATSQLSLLLLIAYAVAWKLVEWKQVLVRASSEVNDMLNPRYFDWIKKVADGICKQENAYIIWKWANFPMALESAIKIQEVSYIHAEWFAGWELKHWPIALISSWVPCIVLFSNDETRGDVISNATELKARWGFIIWVWPVNDQIFDVWIKVPDAESAGPIVNIIPIQILAYFLAVCRWLNPDMPRNLAKSVTVK